jgi:hypothetical protein
MTTAMQHNPVAFSDPATGMGTGCRKSPDSSTISVKVIFIKVTHSHWQFLAMPIHNPVFKVVLKAGNPIPNPNHKTENKTCKNPNKVFPAKWFLSCHKLFSFRLQIYYFY